VAKQVLDSVLAAKQELGCVLATKQGQQWLWTGGSVVAVPHEMMHQIFDLLEAVVALAQAGLMRAWNRESGK